MLCFRHRGKAVVSTEEETVPPRGRWTVSGDLNVPIGRTGGAAGPQGREQGAARHPQCPGRPSVNTVHTETPFAQGFKCINSLTFATVLQVKEHHSSLPLTDEKMKFERAERTVQGHP